MAASRMGAQYRATVALRQFRYVAEDVSYVGDDGQAVALMAVVNREPVQEREKRDNDGLYEVQRAVLSVLSVVDPVYGGVLLDTPDKKRDFVGKNFSVALEEGGALAADWIVKSVTPAICGQWDLSVVREKRVEVGKTRKN